MWVCYMRFVLHFPQKGFSKALRVIPFGYQLVTNGARFNKLCSCLYPTTRSGQSPTVLGKKIRTLAEQLTAGYPLQALIFQKLYICVLLEYTNYCSSQEIKDFRFTHRHFMYLLHSLLKKAAALAVSREG